MLILIIKIWLLNTRGWTDYFCLLVCSNGSMLPSERC